MSRSFPTFLRTIYNSTLLTLRRQILYVKMSSSSSSPILPLELMTMISQYLSWGDRYRFSRINRALYWSLAPSLWACLHLEIPTFWREDPDPDDHSYQKTLNRMLAQHIPLFIVDSPSFVLCWITKLHLNSFATLAASYLLYSEYAAGWTLNHFPYFDEKESTYRDWKHTVRALKPYNFSEDRIEPRFNTALRKLIPRLIHLKTVVFDIWPYQWLTPKDCTSHEWPYPSGSPDLYGYMNICMVSYVLRQKIVGLS